MPINSIFSPTSGLRPVRNSFGVIETAVPEPQPEPAQPPELPAEPAPQSALDVLQGQLQEAAGPVRIGQFIPEDAAEAAQIRRGSFGATFERAYLEGILGRAFEFDSLSQADEDRLSAETANYAARAPIRSIAASIAGRFVSDSPLEVGIGLISGPLGIAVEAANKSRLAGRAAFRTAKAAAELRRARLEGFSRFTAEAQTDALEGLATGVLSESILQRMGKPGDVSDILTAGVGDAVASPIFGFVLRNTARLAGKSFSSVREGYIEQTSKDLAEQTGLKEDDIKNQLERQLPNEEGAAPRQPEAPVAAVDPAIEARIAAKPEARKIFDDFEAEPTPARFERAVNELADEADPNLAADITDIFKSRARSAGLKFEDYVRAKGFRFRESGRAATVFREAETILEAPLRATTRAEFLHEIGHIARSDLNPQEQLAFTQAFELPVEPGRPWSVEQEEQVAEAIREWLESGSPVETPLDSAFKRFTDWIKNVYGNLLEKLGLRRAGREDANTLIRQLFSEGEQPFAQATPETQAAFARALEDLQTGGRLFAPEELGIDGLSQANVESIAREQRKLRQIQIDMQKPALGLDSGTLVPKTKAATTAQNVLNKMGRTLGSDAVLSLINYAPGLGKTFDKIMRQAPQSSNRTAELFLKMDDSFTDAIKRSGVTVDEIAQMNSVPTPTKLQTTKGAVTLKLTRAERIQLYLYSKDGTGLTEDNGFNTSAQRTLVDPKGGFAHKGTKHVLTEPQLRDINQGRFLSEQDAKIADAFFESYRAIVSDANKISRDFVGFDIFNLDNKFYNPKVTFKQGKESDLLFEALISRENIAAARGPLAKRKGPATLQLVNPFAERLQYSRRVSSILGNLRLAKQLRVAYDAANKDGALQTKLGKNVAATLNNLIDILGGEQSALGTSTGAGINRLYQLRQIGILSSPSVVLKQGGSAWSAYASGNLDRSTGSEIFQKALELLKDTKKRDAIRAEWEKYSPFMTRRQQQHVQFIELEGINGGMGVVQSAFKEQLPFSEVRKLLKDKNVKVTEVMIEGFGKFTAGIKIADEGIMGSVWEAAKKQVDRAAGESDGSYFYRVNDLFTKTALESQPTIDPVSRSFNQMQRNFFFKALTQFSTQTRKNAEIAFKSTMALLNIDPDKRTAQDRRLWAQAMLPLWIQSAYATAAGAIVAGGLEQLNSIVRSEERQKRIDQNVNNKAADLFRRHLRDTFGQIPVTGAPLSEFIGAYFGGKPFGSEIPLIAELTELSLGISERDVRKITRATLTPAGVPDVISKPISEIVGRVQE